MTLKWVSWLAMASLTVAVFMGCTQPQSQAESTLPPESPMLERNDTAMTPPAQVDPQLIAAQNRFGFELLNQLWQADPNKNLLVSPLSVSMALAMTQNGAVGGTLEAMMATLNLEGMEVGAVNQAIAHQIAALETTDPESQLSLANSLWADRDGVELQAPFVQTVENNYGATVESLDFKQADTALETINQWVSEATAGKIPGILDQIRPNDVLFLLNAIYFKGTWQIPFEPGLTTEEPFYGIDGQSNPQPLMQRYDKFTYLENEVFQAVRLSYGNGRLGMVVLLPRPEVAPGELQAQLTAENWQQWMGEFGDRPGQLKLPRFQMEYDTGLNDSLTALGMGVAFDPDQADFSRLSNRPTFISEVKHKTVIEVNEAGTEAAGATSVGISVTSVQIEPTEPFEMVVNRPFFLAIQEQGSSSILFMGWVMEPGQ